MGIVTGIKDGATKFGKGAAHFTGDKITALRDEANSVKEVLQSDSPIFKKTDTIAILVKKLGRSDIFQEALDRITKEGYVFTFKEEVRDIPLPSGFKLPLGTLYYFQNARYRLPDNFQNRT